MRRVDFDKLPRTTRERLIDVFRLPADAVGHEGAPLFVRPYARAWQGPVASCVILGGVCLAFGARGFGDVGRHAQSSLHVVLYAAVLGIVAFVVRRLVLAPRRVSMLPFAPGTYAFASDVIVAESRELRVYPLSECKHTEVDDSVTFVFPDRRFRFEVGDRELARQRSLALTRVRESLGVSRAAGDAKALLKIDPLFFARVRDFEAIDEDGPRVGPVHANPTRAAALVLIAAVAGLPLWWIRNRASDEVAFWRASRDGHRSALETYAASGGRHTQTVRDVLLPGAELEEAKRQGTVVAAEAFMATHPGVLDAEAKALLMERLHEEFERRNTVPSLREFAEKWPAAADASRVASKIRDLREAALAAFHARANTSDSNVVPIAEALVRAVDRAPAGAVLVRFRRSPLPSLASADKLLATGLLEETGPARGGGAEVSKHFDEAQSTPRERAAVRALASGFGRVFGADMIPVVFGAPFEAKELASPAVPTMFVAYDIGWSGATYVGRDSGRRFVGVVVKFDVTLKVPGDPRAVHFTLRVEPPEAFSVDYASWDPSLRAAASASSERPEDARVYDVMALRAFDQLSAKLESMLVLAPNGEGSPGSARR
ncbi:hypothetical protein [Labilithrix luteola]|uniref:hypothetical protein n=1 Tax=Labilithrix luteola TaxID=1391654 RepID=UPI0011BAA458|nr:hypothetical protein [Labilithrix luteola]